jgi:lysophospholipase L1-like esterase
MAVGRRCWALLATGLLVVTGCSSGTSTSVAEGPSPTRSATASPYPTKAPGTLSLVGLGDSLPGALGCETCPSFVTTYGELAAKVLGKPVTVTNLATNDSLTSGQLLSRVTDDPEHRAALAQADLVTLTIGANDWQGPCADSGAEECLRNGQQTAEEGLTSILDAITALRKGQPTAVRVTDYYNSAIGNQQVGEQWGFDPTPANTAAFQAKYAKALADFDAMICRVARQHGAVCVDLVTAFNGPRHDTDAGPLLGPDHGHPSADGHRRIAQLLAAAGFAPLA